MKITRTLRKALTGLAGVGLLAGISLTFSPAANAAGSEFVPGTTPAPVWYPANGSADENPTNNGTGPALAWTGSAAYGPGAFGEIQSFAFDGTNGLNGGTTLGDFAQDAFYISFDLKTTASGPLPSQLISKRDQCPSVDGYLDINLRPNGTIEGGYGHGTSDTYIARSTTAVNDGNWHTIALAQYESVLRLFVDGVQEGATSNIASVPNMSNTGSFSVATGDDCTANGYRQPLVGDIDNIYLADLTNGDTIPVDVSASQASVPTVAAGDSGSFQVNLTNPSTSTSGTSLELEPPAGVTFTGVSGGGGQCAIVTNDVHCGYGTLLDLAPGATTITVNFTTNPDVAPDSTLTSNTSTGLTNQVQADPNHYNDAWIPISVNIAPKVGAPMANWAVGGGAAGLIVLGGAGITLLRRRRRTAPATS